MATLERILTIAANLVVVVAAIWGVCDPRVRGFIRRRKKQQRQEAANRRREETDRAYLEELRRTDPARWAYEMERRDGKDRGWVRLP